MRGVVSLAAALSIPIELSNGVPPHLITWLITLCSDFSYATIPGTNPALVKSIKSKSARFQQIIFPKKKPNDNSQKGCMIHPHD